MNRWVVYLRQISGKVFNNISESQKYSKFYIKYQHLVKLHSLVSHGISFIDFIEIVCLIQKPTFSDEKIEHCHHHCMTAEHVVTTRTNAL